MKRSGWLCLFFVPCCLLVPSCDEETFERRSDEAVPIAFDVTRSGILSNTDHRGPRGFEDRYSFEGRIEQSIVLAAEYQGFDGYLSLVAPSGALEAFNDDSGGIGNSFIRTELRESGLYVVVVTTYSSDVTGSYTVSLRRSSSDPVLADLNLGQSLTGALAASDGFGERGFEDLYAFNGRSGQRIVLSASFEDFDGYLILRAPSGGTEAYNDDADGIEYSRIETTLRETGRYVVVVTTYSSGDKGDYTLRLTGGE